MNVSFKHAFAAFILASGVTMAAPSSAQSPDKRTASVPNPATSKLFAIVYRQGPKWKTGLPMGKQALTEHFYYYQQALKEGRLFAGGALPAINGGLAILKMSSIDEAKAFLAADPALLNGTFLGEVHAWTPNPKLVTNEPLKP